MQQAVSSLTIMPDALSSDIYIDLIADESTRLDEVHARLGRMSTLIGILLCSEDVRGDTYDLLKIINDLVGAARLLTGDEARLINAMPQGLDPLWSRPSYAAQQQGGAA